MVVITKNILELVVPLGTSLEELGVMQRAILALLRNQRDVADPEHLAAIADLLEATLLDDDQLVGLQLSAKK